MTTFQDILNTDSQLIVDAHIDLYRLFSADEHEMIAALIAMGEE